MKIKKCGKWHQYDNNQTWQKTLQPHFIVMVEKILEQIVCIIVQKFNSIENEGTGTKGNKKYGLLKHMSNSNAGLIPLF